MSLYYLDTAADAGGDGTTTALTGAHCAFKAVSQVAAVFAAGNAFYGRRGCHWHEAWPIGASGTINTPILISDYGTGALPTLSGLAHVVTWANHSGSIWSANLAAQPKVVTFDGTVGTPRANHDACTAEYDWAWEAGVLYCFAPGDPDSEYTNPGVEAGTARSLFGSGYTARSYITIENWHVTGCDGEPGIFGVSTTGWTLSGLTIDKSARTSIHLIAPHDLVIHGVTITGLRALNPGWRGIYCPSATDGSRITTNVDVHDTDIAQCGGYGIQIMGYNSTYRAHDITVHDCDLSHNLTGLYLSYCDTGTVYELVCDDNLRGPGITTGEEYGIALQTVSNFTIHDFSCTNGRCGMEIWAFIFGHDPYPLSGPSDNNHVYNGVLANNTQNGFIMAEGCASYTKLEYIDSYNNVQGGFNISEGHGAGVGCHVYNCNAYNNDTGNGGYGNFHFGSPCAGWTLKNNIAFAVTGYAFRCTHASGFLGTHAHNNWWKVSGNIIDNYGTYYAAAAIATWEADGGMAVNPQFVSTTPGSENFDIQNGSPLIDQGEQVGLTADILGRPIV